MRILAIESSCDETAAAIVRDGKEVLSNIIATQIPVHQIYGGVVPEIASRCHLQNIAPTVEQALQQANMTFDDVDAIAVTAGPGLVGALLVGVSYAKALAYALQKPLIGVHHWQGHLCALQLEHDIEYPYLALVASGSHSGIVEVLSDNDFRLLGASLDDAAGEAFDKISRALGLGYPGGPAIQKAALLGDAAKISFPIAKTHDTYDFSFSGLKSAVLNHINQRRMRGEELTEQDKYDLAASAQEAICTALAEKTLLAAQTKGYSVIGVVGGVAANQLLRQKLADNKNGIRVIYPSPIFCTDNAAMIGAAAYHYYQRGEFADMSLNADPRKPIYFA